MPAGRPRKILEFSTKQLTKAQKTEKQLAENELKNLESDQLLKPPAWLIDATAKKEWKRLVEQFKTLGFLTNLDINNLGAYCNAYSLYLKATDEIKKSPMIVTKINKIGAENEIENPLIKIQIKYSDEMKKYSNMLGLTIDSRLKIAGAKLEKKKTDLVEDFGDI